MVPVKGKWERSHRRHAARYGRPRRPVRAVKLRSAGSTTKPATRKVKRNPRRGGSATIRKTRRVGKRRKSATGKIPRQAAPRKIGARPQRGVAEQRGARSPRRKKRTVGSSAIAAVQRILITSALPYVNNMPHLGNLIGCVLSADVFARYCRRSGKQVLFVCGADEHGTATEFKAQEEGLTPQQICDTYYAIHWRIYDWFGCSFDIFGRTANQIHHYRTQQIFKRLDANGYIRRDTLQQTFCRRCDKFLADRFVEGQCPHCGYAQARGDQCDSCGKLLEAIELWQPKCKTCGSTPEIRESTHLFLDLPKLGPKLQQWIRKAQEEGAWTENAKRITAAWFTEGLKPRCITRDLKWGVPVPKQGFEDKVFYVWFDAPIGYISIAEQLTAKWKAWWMPKQRGSVALYQFMAKDNIPFHTILFPATLIGSGQPWTMLHHIDATEYLNYENGKFSKSLGQGVFGDDAMQSGIPADVWRYYLLVNRPETADSPFTWGDFQEKANSELLANLGNFVNRTLTFLERSFSGVVPHAALTAEDEREVRQWNAQISLAGQLLAQVKEREALKEVMHLSRMGNAYFQQNEPWKKIREDAARAATVLSLCTNLVANLANCIEPFLPHTAKAIADQLRMLLVDWPRQFTTFLAEGHRIGTPTPLFRKLEDGEIAELRERFSGQRSAAPKQELVEQTQQSTHQRQHRKHAESEGGSLESFSAVDLRVAAVRSVEPHPNADKLYILQIDLGAEQRQLVAGLQAHYAPDQLMGKHIVVVANLKPAEIRGVASQGMLLAAEQGRKVRVLEARQCTAGESVFAQGIAKKPKEQITIEEFLALGMRVGQGVPQWNGRPLRTKHAFLTVAEVNEGEIR